MTITDEFWDHVLTIISDQLMVDKSQLSLSTKFKELIDDEVDYAIILMRIEEYVGNTLRFPNENKPFAASNLKLEVPETLEKFKLLLEQVEVFD